MRMPFYIEVANKRILIIGGGSEGSKRAAKYAEAGARVTVLAQNFDADLRSVISSGTIETVKGDVSDSQLVDQLINNSDLVMVALDTKEHNNALVAAAHRAGKFVNLTNDSASTEIVVPVEDHVRSIRLAATSEGKSVHATREALKRAANFLEQQSDLWLLLDLMQELRQVLRRRAIPVETRMRIYRAVYWDQRVREQALAGSVEEARAAMYAALSRELQMISNGR
jgi:precorrin-2 dehydrogenase/sirohydrochlorin ferrochelatase